MTTVIYQDGVMACDTQVTFGQSKHLFSKKIRRINGCLVGAAGPVNVCQEYMRWFKENVKTANTQSRLPKFSSSESGNYEIMIVTPKGEIWFQCSNNAPERVYGKYYGIGSGKAYAVTALHLGQDVKQAVRTAMKFDTGTGGNVHTLRLGK
jgi:ATP-dependent protease HslVU (ClpYQ) peptidase subunit